MRPLIDRMTISVFRDLNESASGLVANEAVASHNDRPSYGRVEVVSEEIASDISPGDVVMFSRFAGVPLDRSGLKRMLSLKEIMAIAEPSDMLSVQIKAGPEGDAFLASYADATLAPGAVVTLEDDRASVLGVLAKELHDVALATIGESNTTVLRFRDGDGIDVEITTSTKSLFNEGQLVARGHKVDGKFWRYVD